jgi:hypothetical protein
METVSSCLTSRVRAKGRLIAVLAAGSAFVSALGGCITAVGLEGQHPPNGGHYAVFLGQQTFVWVTGDGSRRCAFRLHFGDSQATYFSNIGLDQNPDLTFKASHVYRGWPGPTRLRVEGVKTFDGDNEKPSCEGVQEARVDILQPGSNGPSNFELDFALAMNNWVNVCDAPQFMKDFPVLPKASITIKSDVVFPLDYCRGGCTHDPSGELNSVAPATFPFPGLPKYAIIYMVGSQLIPSGSTETRFVVNNSRPAPLLVCVNDDDRGDNSGGLLLRITVDHSNAILTSDP